MPITSVLWRLASPYDAFVNHVGRLNEAIERIRYFAEMALAYEAGLHGSVRFMPGGEAAEQRVQRFRERVGAAAAAMTDEQFEEFVAHLGGGAAAEVEADRARTVSRLGTTTRGLEEYFAMAGHELTVLEDRGFNPRRPDVARQLRANSLPDTDTAGYRHMLHELGTRVGMRP